MTDEKKKEESTTPAPTPTPKKKTSKRIWKRRIRRAITLAVIAAMAFGGYQYFHKDEVETAMEEVTDVVSYGAITSVVEGSGITKAKNSESITLTTASTVLDVLVSEGSKVMAGDSLFIVDSPAASTAVTNARNDVDGYQSTLNTLYKDIAGLNLSPTYPGKLMDVVTLNPGDTISKGQKVATLSDDTKLRLGQYYSYAYEGQIYKGQSVTVSIPALMTSIQGTVEAVHMVSRITPEGSKLFSVDVVIDNPGTLTAEMAASATIDLGGEVAYPYESSALDYYRTGDLCSTVSGTVISSALVDYLQVSVGQTLVVIDGEDSQAEIFTAEQALLDAQETLADAEKNLANCHGVAPIDGTVIGLSIGVGDELSANTTVLTIADTNTIIVDATVDERNISFVKAGGYVDIDQWGNFFMGMVESVSLNSTVNNGVATYPMVISVDNYEGTLMTGSYVSYSMVASQNDNCLIVPLQCVKTVPMPDGTSGTVVYVKVDEMPENAIELEMGMESIPEGYWPVPVVTGIADNYNVEIKSGVEADTTVFTQMRVQNSWESSMGGMYY